MDALLKGHKILQIIALELLYMLVAITLSFFLFEIAGFLRAGHIWWTGQSVASEMTFLLEPLCRHKPGAQIRDILSIIFHVRTLSFELTDSLVSFSVGNQISEVLVRSRNVITIALPAALLVLLECPSHSI